jgi:hypothetical protein
LATTPLITLRSQTDDIPKIVKLSRHSLSFGFGLVSENKQFKDDLFSKGTFGDLYNLLHYNFGDLETTGALNLNYSYYLNNKISFGCFISYLNFSRNIYGNGENGKMGFIRERYSSLTPRITLLWYRKNVFQMYSAAGASIGQAWTKYALEGEKFSGKEFEVKPQLTLIGVHAGRRVYGFGEINIGGRLGYLNMGVGYRIARSQKHR